MGEFEAGADVKFQYNDMYKNIFMGIEKTVLSDTVKLRAGLHQGYPTIGVGLDIAFFHTQYAYYTEERGDKVGDNPVSYHGFDLGFYF